MPKPTTWVVIVVCGILGLAIFGCVLTAVISGIKSAHETAYNNELLPYKKVSIAKCKNCGQITATDTLDAKMRRIELKDRKFVIFYRDALCGPCKVKQAQTAERYLKEGQRAFSIRAYETALDKFDTAESLGNEDAAKWRKRTDDILNEMARSQSRADYAVILREHFLDKNMDVKVWITGKDNKYLHMQFVLFDDVWVHNFKEGDLIQEIRKLEFERVYFTDGFGYSTYIYW